MPNSNTNPTSLLDALRAGKSTDDLMKEFQSQLDAAKSILDQEKNDKLEELKDYEDALVEAFMNYFVVLTDYLGIEMEEEEKEELTKMINGLMETMRGLKDISSLGSKLFLDIFNM